MPILKNTLDNFCHEIFKTGASIVAINEKSFCRGTEEEMCALFTHLFTILSAHYNTKKLLCQIMDNIEHNVKPKGELNGIIHSCESMNQNRYEKTCRESS